MKKSLWFVLIVTFLLLFQNCVSTVKEKPGILKPNILFILIDDLGKEWVSTYGADDVQTPNVDKLAATGMSFMNTYSMPQCTPSRVALLTGQYPWRNGWINAPFIVNCPGIIPGWKITDALVDFPDMLPTFAELGRAKIPKEDTIDGMSFAPLILGKQDDSPRKWIMALGSHPSSIRNSRVVNYFTFRDRVIRDKKYKAYIDTTKNIYELYDLSSDLGERNNLLGSHNPEVQKALEKFSDVLQTLPGNDANPKYNKLDTSFFGIPVNVLNRKSKKGSQAPNKSPGPYYETNKNQ